VYFLRALSAILGAPLSLHDALPISLEPPLAFFSCAAAASLAASSSVPALSAAVSAPSEAALAALSIASTTRGITVSVSASCAARSEEHTSELQSRFDLVCRLLLEKQ